LNGVRPRPVNSIVGRLRFLTGALWIAAKRDTTMIKMTDEEKVHLLQVFADAWNHHDLDTLMACMTDDCTFEASAGSDVCGTRSVGQQEVRAAFSEVFATFPDAQWRGARHFADGDRGVSEWTFTGTRADGARFEVNGCDLLTFRDRKIAIKDSYRKNRPALGAQT
jgi:ketosteroid isomerase-like protein